MVNVTKYFLILEEFKFPENRESSDKTLKQEDEECFQHNLKVLRRFIKETTLAILQQQIEYFHLKISSQNNIEELDEKCAFILLLQHVLLEIVNNTNFNSDAREDLVSTRHMNLCIEAVQNLGVFALRQQIHPLICKTGVYSTRETSDTIPNYVILQLSVEFYARILHIKQFHVANSMEDVLRDYMAAIYTLRIAGLQGNCDVSDDQWKQLQTKLNAIWLDISKIQYLRNILMLKGLPQLPVEVQKQLHLALLHKLQSKDGFSTLVATLYAAQQQQRSTDRGEQQVFEIVAQIVAHRALNRAFQSAIIEQIFRFLKICLRNESMLRTMGAGLLSLRRLYDLHNENQALVKKTLNSQMQQLVQPPELLSSLILMEHTEFCDLIALWHELFCTSVVECLPSALLIVYLPLLIQVYYDVPPAFTLQRRQLTSLITRCLDNRTSGELEDILDRLYTANFRTDWHKLHVRVLLSPNAMHTELRVLVAPVDFKADFSLSLALPELLMNSEHNVLTYRIFMILLRLWNRHADEQNETTAASIDLLHSEEELLAFLHSKYPVKVDILLSLNTLIGHQPLKSQIGENVNDFLKFMRDLIAKKVTQVSTDESCDQILLILLTITEELLTHAQLPVDQFANDFLPSLRQLQHQNHNQLVQQRVTALQSLLSGDDSKESIGQNDAAFQMARLHIESSQPHLQVYGIQQLLALLQQRDPTTMANGHVIIALALNTLKSPESYTFLNCVRIFVALVHVMEAHVLDLLADEYLSETASMDYRLVVGEVLIKVSKELGPLCYKYKDVLLNTFMSGARSNHNEFRMSAFANLAQLCRILCYQVHKFFQELLNLIDCELTTGNYLPSKRAAVLVLSELLEGMNNLLDFGEMLLPVYKLLKLLEASPPGGDERIRVHAANGLKALNEKCQQLLFPAQTLHKEITVLGIKETSSKSKHSLKQHILDLS